MTSSNGNIFRVTGHLCEEFTGDQLSPHKGQWRGALMFSLICVWINSWVNNGEAGDLRRYHAHYDVTIMKFIIIITFCKLCIPRVVWTICLIYKPNKINNLISCENKKRLYNTDIINSTSIAYYFPQRQMFSFSHLVFGWITSWYCPDIKWLGVPTSLYY